MVGSDIIVVGGGILGLRIATELSARGQSVSLVSDAGERASDASLVWLNVISTETTDYAMLRVAAMRLWHDILARDATCPVRIKGALLWDRDVEGLEKLSAFQNDIGWETQVIGKDRFEALAPGIAKPPAAALLAPGEAAADPNSIMDWAETQASIARVSRIEGRVSKILIDGAVATGIQLQDGRVLSGSGVVIANGNGAGELLRQVGVDPGLKDAPGMLVRTSPLPKISDAVMASPLMDFWQDGDGRVLIATGTHDTMVDDLQGSARAALRSLTELVPAAQDAGYQTLTQRNRPIPGDGFPVIGPIPGINGLWGAITHSGMTLAPVIAVGVSDMVLGEMTKANFEPFLPRRMFEG